MLLAAEPLLPSNPGHHQYVLAPNPLTVSHMVPLFSLKTSNVAHRRRLVTSERCVPSTQCSLSNCRPPFTAKNNRNRRHVTSEMSFSPVMVASRSQPNRTDYNVAGDLEEDMDDSDEANEDVSNEAIKFIVVAESQFPPTSVHTSSRKRRSEGGSLGDSKRQRQELLDSSKQDAQVQNSLHVFCMKEEARAQPQPSTYQQVLTKLREHPGVAAKILDFLFNVMEYIRREKDADYFIIFDNNDVRRYLKG